MVLKLLVVPRGYHFKFYNSFDEGKTIIGFTCNLYAIFFELLDLIEEQLQEVNVSHKFDTIRIDVNLEMPFSSLNELSHLKLLTGGSMRTTVCANCV